MAKVDVRNIVELAPRLLTWPSPRVWTSYDAEADVLYLNFKKPSHADDSELTDDDVLIRYENGEVIGLTIMHASTRLPDFPRPAETPHGT